MDRQLPGEELIPVSPPGEPTTFDVECRQKGNAWLAANPKPPRLARTKIPSYWGPYTDELRTGFNHLCGYAAMLCPSEGTVDHFISVKTDEAKAYNWKNYRFASSVWNNIKRRKDDRVLDPFEVQAGWFEISLPDLQLGLSSSVPAHMITKAKFTLTKMKLRDDERIIRWRKAWYDRYQAGTIGLEALRSFAPLIAEAVDRRIAAGAPR